MDNLTKKSYKKLSCYTINMCDDIYNGHCYPTKIGSMMS